MKKKQAAPRKKKPDSLSELRRAAEKKLRMQAGKLKELSALDVQKLVHELGTYQIELDLQNEELRRAQTELEASRSRYVDLYDFAPVGYFTFDRSGVILEINFTGANLLGLAKRSLAGRPFSSFILLDDRDIFAGHIKEVLTGQTSRTCEIRLVKRDRSMLHVRLQSIPAEDEAGNMEYCRTIAVDISERKRAEAALKESEEKYRTIFEGASEGIIACDLLTGKFLFANKRFTSLTGYSEEEIQRLGVKDIHPPKDLPYVLKEFNEMAAGNKIETRDIPVLRKDKSVIYCDIGSSFMSKNTLIGFFRDVTERKKAEEAMQRERDLLQTVMNGAKNSHLVYLDRVFNFVRVNETYAQTCGYRPEEMIGKNHFALYPHAENEAIFAHVRDTGEVYEVHDKPFEFPDQPERGITYWDWTLTPVKDTYGRVEGLIFSLYETTERKNTEEAMKRSKHDLEKRTAELALVNKELEVFSYTISHDLKAPLRSIEGFSGAILEDYEDKLDETCKDYFHRILAAGRRMNQLIDALLKMSRMTGREIAKDIVNLSSIAEVAAYELKKKRPDRPVEFIISKKIKARGDMEMLKIVIENLLDNAYKFTWKNPSARIEFGVLESAVDKKVYYVKDDGTGFDMQFADKLFRPFQRLHKDTEFPGLGIGLTIVHKIITRHGGQIWAESEIGKGAAFYFALG